MFMGFIAALFGFLCLCLGAMSLKARPALEGKQKVGQRRERS